MTVPASARLPESRSRRERAELVSLRVRQHVPADVAVQDVDAAASRITELGGRRLPQDDYHEDGYSWRIMADPEGNEFCLIYGQYQPGPTW